MQTSVQQRKAHTTSPPSPTTKTKSTRTFAGKTVRRRRRKRAPNSLFSTSRLNNDERTTLLRVVVLGFVVLVFLIMSVMKRVSPSTGFGEEGGLGSKFTDSSSSSSVGQHNSDATMDEREANQERLRAMRLRRHENYNKEEGNGGGGFLQRVVDKIRDRRATPDDDDQPFPDKEQTDPEKPPSTSGKYEHPDKMKGIGDPTAMYAELRREYDSLLPPSSSRTLKFVETLRQRTYVPIEETKTYDVHNCPLFPTESYPEDYNVLDVLGNWPPDDTERREKIYRGICVFDYETELEKAKNYREAEVPFVVRNDPSVLRTVERWNQPSYLEKLLGDVEHRTEYSPNNHFMYWMAPRNKRGKKKRHQNAHFNADPAAVAAGDGRSVGDVTVNGANDVGKRKGPPEGWTPPTQLLRMKFTDWLKHANTTDDSKLGPDNPHWYYRLIGCGFMADGHCDRDSSEYLFDELPFFQPRKDQLFLADHKAQKGIHCRFGMKGVIAENHFDGSRNAIAVFGGERRYILSHPKQCLNLALLPKGHPSARHSAVDWSDVDLKSYPQFKSARVNEIILQAGDVLYLPTNWFHYIVSLEMNYQCNTRSGISHDYAKPIHECGF